MKQNTHILWEISWEICPIPLYIKRVSCQQKFPIEVREWEQRLYAAYSVYSSQYILYTSYLLTQSTQYTLLYVLRSTAVCRVYSTICLYSTAGVISEVHYREYIIRIGAYCSVTGHRLDSRWRVEIIAYSCMILYKAE